MRHWLVCVPVVLAACATAGPGAPPAPGGAGAALAWSLTGPMSVDYEMADTIGLSMQAGGTDVRVDVSANAAASVDLVPASDGARATIRFTALEGRASNSMGPTVTVGAADLPGPAEVSVSRRGVVEIVQVPELSANLRRILGPNDLYRRMFLRLPGHAIARGAEWTDTISVSEQNNGLTSSTTTVLRSVWARDTVVGGRTLNVITSNATSEARIAGTTDGVQIEQNLTGAGTAITLWDPARRIIVERQETGTASGGTDLPAMGVQGMATSLRAVHTMRLQRVTSRE